MESQMSIQQICPLGSLPAGIKGLPFPGAPFPLILLFHFIAAADSCTVSLSFRDTDSFSRNTSTPYNLNPVYKLSFQQCD